MINTLGTKPNRLKGHVIDKANQQCMTLPTAKPAFHVGFKNALI
jgi:hypothetical protein